MRWRVPRQHPRTLDRSRLHRYGRTVEPLLWLAGAIAVVLLIAWLLRRSRRNIDEVDDGGYRPPPIHGQSGPH